MHVLKQAGLFVSRHFMDSPPGVALIVWVLFSTSGSRATAHSL